MAEENKLIIRFPSETDKNAWLDFVKDARKFYSDATPLSFKDEAHYREWLNRLINLNIGTTLKPGEVPQSTFFMFSEVPPITKTGDISLEYTIIISID